MGSAVCGGTRLSRYYFSSVLSSGSPVYLNILQYGHAAFSVAILENLGATGAVTTREMLAREQYYITLLMESFPGTCLNANPIAGSSTGYKHTQAAKELIALSRTGKPLSDSTKELLSSMFSGASNPFAFFFYYFCNKNNKKKTKHTHKLHDLRCQSVVLVH